MRQDANEKINVIRKDFNATQKEVDVKSAAAIKAGKEKVLDSFEKLFEEVASPCLAAWEDETWFNYTIGDGPEKMPSGDRSLLKCGLIRDLDIPACLPSPARMPLTIKAEKATWVPLVETLLTRMLASTPGIRIHILDPEGNGSTLARFGKADTSKGGVFEPVKVTSADITETLVTLRERVAMVAQSYLQGVVENIHQYNQEAATPEDVHILVALNPETYTGEQIRELEKLTSTGWRCGVNVLKVIGSLGGAKRLTQEAQAYYRDIKADITTGDTWIMAGAAEGETTELIVEPEPGVSSDIIHAVVKWAEAMKAKGVKPLTLSAALPKAWTAPGPSIKAVIGKSGTTDFTLELGIRGAHPHLLIAGRTGTGKSTLLHSIICAYASTYSPEDLQFYLVDAKQGVEMKHYTPGAKNLPEGHWLPHLAIGAVKTDMRAYVSVLEKIRKDIKERGKLCSDHGVSDVYELAVKEPGFKVPRIVVILDEFHVLLTDQQYGPTAASMLKDIAKQARAYGIHLILATQSLGNLGARGENAALFEQIGNRIALGCEANVSEMVLGLGNLAASRLTRQGEAIFTSVIGAPEHNVPFQVGFINPEKERPELISALWEKAGKADEPFVFSGEGLTNLEQSPLWKQASKANGRMWVGAPVKIASHLSIKMDDYPGGHVLFYGAANDDEEDLAGVLQSCALSLALSEPGLEVTLFEPGEDRPIHKYLVSMERNLHSLGAKIETVAPGRRSDDKFEAIENMIKERPENGNATVLVLIPDGDASVKPKKLAYLIEQGAQKGVHVMCSFGSRRALTGALGATTLEKALSFFDTRIFMTLSSVDASASTLGLPEKPANEEERFTLWEASKPNKVEVFIPYQSSLMEEPAR